MPILNPAFTDLNNRGPILWNTDIKEYTTKAWLDIGALLAGGDWANDPNSNGTGLEAAEHIDGSWHIRGSISNNSTFDFIRTVLRQDEVLQWRGIAFQDTEGRSFGIPVADPQVLAFNAMFGFGTGGDATTQVLGVGVRSASGLLLPQDTLLTFNLRIYPKDT